MTPTDITAALIAFAERGIAVTVSPSGTLQVRPASALAPEDREWLGTNAGAILVHLEAAVAPTRTATLSGREPWDVRVALKLTTDADALVAQLGVDGRHPTVVDAAATVVSAYETHDLETIRFAVAEFVVAVRERARRTTERTSAEVLSYAGDAGAVPSNHGDTRPKGDA